MKIDLDKEYWRNTGERVKIVICVDIYIDGKPAVIFRKIDIDPVSGEPDPMSAMTKENFERNFIPTELSLGDKVLYVSMGKILGRYSVTMVNKRPLRGHAGKKLFATITSENGKTREISGDIKANGVIDTHPSDLPLGEFLYVSWNMEKKMSVRNALVDIVSEVEDLKRVLQKAVFCNYNEVKIEHLQGQLNNLQQIRKILEQEFKNEKVSIR